MTKPPIMCGFFRMTAPMWETREDRRITLELMAFAAEHGYVFGCMSIEDEASSRLGAWRNMIGFCQDVRVRNIAVPTLEDFDASPELAAHIRDDLAEEIGGTVWVMAKHAQEATS